MPDAITLRIPSQIVLAGSTVEGAVELNFPLIQEEQLEGVRVKLKGSVFTFLGQPRTELTETLDLDIVRIEHPVWTRGTAYPPPDSHVLSIPFSFALPDSAPPSYQFSRLDCQSVVRYLVEAVGVRGTLRMNKRVVQPIAVLPVDRIGARVRERLGRGWTGKWTSAAAEKTVRTSLWGGSARAEMTLRLPTVPSFPLFTPVPFTITIITTSKTVKRDSIAEAKPIWPMPPTDSKAIRLELKRQTRIFTQHLSRQAMEKVSAIGGMAGSLGNVHVTTKDRQWIPSASDANKGSWRQETEHASTFVLTCPPAFNWPSLNIAYSLSLHIQFGGWNTTLSTDVPIVVTSGMILPPMPAPAYVDHAAPPDGAPAANGADYALLHSTLDLPPSYWTVAESDNHAD